MRALFPYAQEAIDNTHKIAERCNVEIEFGVTKLPKYEVPEGYDSWSYLNKLCQDGMAKRYPNDDGTAGTPFLRAGCNPQHGGMWITS